MKRTTNILKIYFILSLFISFTHNATSQVTNLKVIPEVQRFVPTNGIHSIPASVKILVNTEKNDSLMPIATQLKEELQIMFQIEADITTTIATQSNSTDEIVLNYSQTTLKNKEAYILQINTATGVTINGASEIGVLWATRTLLQLAENHKNNIPTGTVTDYPDYPSRGFMIDVGRKFFSIDYLKDYVKILSYYKMNEFHVHLNDNGFKSHYNNDWTKTYAAFRLESETYPGLAAEDGHYTKEEFRELQLLGMQYGVNVIPEIDIPAHSLAFTRYKPELKALAPYADDHLDILNDEKLPMIYDFFDKLFDEYIKGDNPTFVGTDVHIGTDEFVKEGDIRNVDNAQAKRFREFTNHYIQYIADLGKTPRLWGGLKWLKDNPLTKVEPTGNAVMNAWSWDWVNPEQMLKDGFKIISTPDIWLYIVPAAGYYNDFLDTQWIYNQYRPEMVNQHQTFPNFQPGILGSTFAVWNDVCGNGISQLDVHYRTIKAVKVVGTKNWKVQPEKSYQEYAALANISSDSPGVNLTGAYSDEAIAAITSKVGETPIEFNGTQELELGGTDLGYKYDVSFDLKPATGNKHNAILFQSKYGKVTLHTRGLGRLGFSRDGFIYWFPFVPKNNVWQNIRITGDHKSVTLYVDGEKRSTLTAYFITSGLPNNINFQQTLSFPLEKLGDANNGFKGEIKNFKFQYTNPEKAKEIFLETKANIANGIYFIKNKDTYLTNNSAKGTAPTFQTKAKHDTTQHFKITLDPATKRYKIVSAADQTKYINELGVFGTNPYDATWNTYHFYMKDGKYAIQNDGNSGKGFWYIQNNRFNRGGEDYVDHNYIITLQPISTGVKNELVGKLKVYRGKNELTIKGAEISKMWLYELNGTLIMQQSGTNKIKTTALPMGTYLLKVETKDAKTSTLKVVL